VTQLHDVDGDISLDNRADTPYTWTRGDSIRTVIAAVIILLLVFGATLLGKSAEFGSKAATSLMIGTALGIVFERGRFCIFCIFRDSINQRRNYGLISIFTALAVGTVGYTIIFGLFLPVPTQDQLPALAHVGPVSLALVLGAFAFGIGMALAGACISGQFYRLTQGYLRAIPGLIGVIIGFLISFNTWNFLYENSIKSAPKIWLPHYLGYTGSLLLSLTVLGGLIIWAIKTSDKGESEHHGTGEIEWSQIRNSLIKKRWSPWVTGSIVGIIGVVAYLRIEPLGTTRQLNTLAQDIGTRYDLYPTLVGLEGLSGCIGAAVEVITNNGWLIIGFFFAALAASISGNRFKVQVPNVKGILSSLVGGTLLGWGSFTSLGCTVGNLLSGTQAFALSGWTFFLFAFIGAWVGIKLKLDKIG
jgi:uncharacterized membrane protein YedE/YeeE